MSVLSVIIPVYNVERYLDICVSSVLNQQYRRLEIILVDDGSTDASPALCDHYAALDSRIRVIHQPNAGVSAARNEGMAAATGDYLTFVDSDDWLSPLMYAEMMQAVDREDGPDVVMCDFINERPDSSEKITARIRSGLYKKSEIVSELYPTLLVTEDLGRLPIVSVWACLFKRSIFSGNSIRFDVSLKYAEDYLFMAEVMVAAHSFCYLKDQHFYHYRQYDESRSKKYKPDWWPNFLALNRKLEDAIINTREYNFRHQIQWQLIHSALFMANTIFADQGQTDASKITHLSKLFNDPKLRQAFRSLPLADKPKGLRLILMLVKYRRPSLYLWVRWLLGVLSHK